MYRPIGVNLDDYHAAIATDHEVSYTLTAMTLDHVVIGQVTVPRIGGGHTWGGPDAEVAQAATVDLLDPGHDLGLDTPDPGTGSVYANRLIRIEHHTTSPLLPTVATVPIITGQPVKYSRDGDVVSLELQSKDMRSQTDHEPVRCGKNTQVVDAIERFLRAYGETWFSFPSNVRFRLADDVVVGREEKTWGWPTCQRLARAAGLQLYYDPLGVATLREVPQGSVFTFTNPITPHVREHDWSEVYNRVEVRGKKKVRAVATPADIGLRTHPFSPESMAAGGQKWERTYFYSDDKIGTNKQAMTVAKEELRALMVQQFDVRFTHTPVWHLTPRDPVTGADTRFAFGEATASFDGDAMGIGHEARVGSPR